MTKSGKQFLALLMTGLMVFGLSACTTSQTETPAAEVPTADTTTTVPDETKQKEIYLFCESSEMVEGLEATTALYTQLHPNVTFIVETNAESYTTSLKAKFAGGEEPDIFGLHGYSDAALYEDYLLDLGNEVWSKDIVDIARDNITVNGKLLGMPMGIEAVGYVYNSKLFEKAGITQVPKSLSEFKAVCDQLRDSGVNPISETYMDSYQGGYFFTNLAIAMQDDPMAFMKGLTAGTSSIVGNAAFERLADLIAYDYSQCVNPMNTDYNTRVAYLASDEVAMTCGGNWLQPSFTALDKASDFLMMGMPLGDDQNYDFLCVSVNQFWGINANSDCVDECRAFLEWLATDPAGQECISVKMQFIPAFKTFSANAEDAGSLGRSVSEYIAADKIKGRYTSFYPDGVADKWGEDVQKFVAGQFTEDEFLKALEEDWYNIAN